MTELTDLHYWESATISAKVVGKINSLNAAVRELQEMADYNRKAILANGTYEKRYTLNQLREKYEEFYKSEFLEKKKYGFGEYPHFGDVICWLESQEKESHD